MSQKYGDVMKILIGMTPVKQALVKQGEDFMGRPDRYSFRQIADGQSLTFGRDTESIWRARKKLVQNALKTFLASPSPTSSSTCLLEEHISKEVDYLVTRLLHEMKEKKSFDPFQYLVISTANVICAICLGKRFSNGDQELLSIRNMLDNFAEVAAAGSPPDFIPVLRYLPNPAMEKLKELSKRFLAFFQKHVNEHYEDFSEGKKSVDNTGAQLPEEKVVNLVNDLMGASFDTVTTVLCWCIMYLVAYPETQKKIQEELGHFGRILPLLAQNVSLLPMEWKSTGKKQLEFSFSEGEEINMTPRYGLVLKLERCEHFQVKERLSKL
ncbi:hypothetical protein lerEdw1_008409 [Lerista edwardsae]|nr:hypothetical protein lerEdw1_008409 [Lerista edwardsae]